MKKKFQIASNRFIIFCIFIGVILLIMAEGMITEKEIGVGIGLAVVGVLFIGIPLVFCPWIYTFDEDGISMQYIFLPKERYLWKNIREINIVYGESSDKYGVIFYLFFGSYDLIGYVEGKCRFYMTGHVSKTFRTKRLLKKYWDGHVEGYFDAFAGDGERIKKRVDKIRKKKKYKPKKEYDAEEVIAMEKGLCAKSKEQIKPYIDQAAQLGLEIRTSYLYVSKKGEQFKKRPDKDYTYMLMSEISYPNETAEDKIIEVSVDLVYVRLGRNAYRGVENKFAFEELNTYMTDVLEEIRKQGMETFVG